MRRHTVLLALVVATLLAHAGPSGADANEAPGAPVGARSVTAGESHTCALLDDATVKCWGNGADGRLGRDSPDSQGDGSGEMAALAPVDLGTGRTATAIAAGRAHTCALLDDATVTCWGDNVSGQLGQDNTDDLGDDAGEMAALGPIDLGEGRTATAVTAGDFHTCALLDDATVKCWGNGANGRLGQGNTSFIGFAPGQMAALLPVNLGTGRTATAITAGNRHTCALLDDATVKCWGNGANGQLGQDGAVDIGDDSGEMAALPPVDLGAGRTATAVTAGSFHTCALLDDATVKCWGFGSSGQLGQDGTDDLGDAPGDMAALPPVNLGAGRTATAVSAGERHTCALLDDDTVECWGFGTNGQLGQDGAVNLGDGAGEMAALTAVNLGAGRTATAITAGNRHTCALLDDATVKCWGNGADGRLGQGGTDDRGDAPGEMTALGPIDVGVDRTVGPRPAVAVSIAEVPGPVLVGGDIDYDITVTNTGGVALTGIDVVAPDVADCVTTITTLAVGAVDQYACTHTTTGGDVPQKTNQVQVTTDQGAEATSNTAVTAVDAPVRRPDAQLRLGAGAFVGNGTYNTTGNGQARSATVPSRGAATFTVRVQNDGNETETFRVRGTGTTNRFAVTYRNGPADVTAAVLAGTFTTGALAPGATQAITVRIQARAGTPARATITRLVTATSTNQATRKDTVRATVTRR